MDNGSYNVGIGRVLKVLLAGGVALVAAAAAVVGTMTVTGHGRFDASSGSEGVAAATVIYHDSLTGRLMVNMANAGSRYMVDADQAFTINTVSDGEYVKRSGSGLVGGSPSGISGLTTNAVAKAASTTTIGDSAITDDGTTVTVTAPVEVNSDGIATTGTSALTLKNATAATAEVPVQYSPRLRLRGHAWDTDGEVSDTWDWWMETQPASAATTSSSLRFYISKNGAAANSGPTINSEGDVSCGTASITATVVAASGSFRLAPAALTAGTMTGVAATRVISTWHQYSWTNAMVTALGEVTSGDVTVCTLPAKTRVVAAILVVSTAATNMDGATVAVTLGTDAECDDYLVSASLLVSENTVYGDADAEVGASLPGSGTVHVAHLPSWTATTAVKARFVTDGAGGKDLADVLTCTGSIYLLTETLP